MICPCSNHYRIDLSMDITWTPIEMDDEEESNDEEQEVKNVADLPKTVIS